MTMDTYIKAGMVHVEGDEEISLDNLKSNSERSIGMYPCSLRSLAWARTGAMMRESMLSDALAVCPLWLLFKRHKGCEHESEDQHPL